MAKLKAVQAQQIVTAALDHDADVIGSRRNGEYCVALMFVRAGRSLAAHVFPQGAAGRDARGAARSSRNTIWSEIAAGNHLSNEELSMIMPLLEATLAQRAVHKVRIAGGGIRARWVEIDAQQRRAGACHVASLAPASIESQPRRFARCLRSRGNGRTASSASTSSHTGGTEQVASCVVSARRALSRASTDGFNIAGIQPGDGLCGYVSGTDAGQYNSLYVFVFSQATDVLLIDAGKGQLAAAAKSSAGNWA